jgi:hypothetical protein
MDTGIIKECRPLKPNDRGSPKRSINRIPVGVAFYQHRI